MKNSIAKKLEISRKELLDIGLRGNTLLHFKPRAQSLTIFDELSAQVFDCLVQKQKTMSFLPLPKGLQDKVESDTTDTTLFPELLEQELDANRHTDNKLQTNINQDRLDKKLLKINTEAETYYQEQGIDILYIALGFLSWYESDSSDLERRAPLVLVPVSLNRKTAQERFKIKYTQVDLGTNLTLKAKLKSDFVIDLPDFNEDFSIAEYFEKIRRIIKKYERWSVLENEMHLGFFKFGKFQMFQDLDSNFWPDNKKPENHPILKALLGDGFYDLNQNESENHFEDNDNVLNLQNLEKFHFIADADSSQTEAVIEIKKGNNLVIQGPPGTGKSQTITNIIAESLSDEKKILFVSEKMVALEVVKRRLDKCNIGDAVLELHSHKSNKKVVVEELNRTLELGIPDIKNRDNQIIRYKELQKKLDDYSFAIKEPILDSEIDFVKAVGLYYENKSKLDEVHLNKLSIPSFEHWSKNKVNSVIILIKDLIEEIKVNGLAADNYFCNSTADNFSPTQKEDIVAQLNSIINDTKTLKEEAEVIIAILPSNIPLNIEQINQLFVFKDYLMSMPVLNGVDVKTRRWSSKDSLIKTTIETGLKLKEIIGKYQKVFVDGALEQDVFLTRQVYVTKSKKWWSFLSSNFRKSKNTLRGLLKVELPEPDECIDMLDTILEYQTLIKDLNFNYDTMTSVFGQNWNGINSNWSELSIISKWMYNLYDLIEKGLISDKVIDYLKDIDTEKVIISPNKISVNSLVSKIYQLNKRLLFDNSYEFLRLDLDNVLNNFKGMLKNIHQIFTIARFNQLKNKLKKHNVGTIADLGYDWNDDPETLLFLFKYQYYRSLIDYAYERNDSIKYFDSTSHARDIMEFKKMDAQLAYFSQEYLTKKHFDTIPSIYNPGEMATIKREVNKKRRHIPIRQLLTKAGNAIQHIKPVFMMSPMSVSTFLKQGEIEFDLVIFDEASQVKVVDALIPILRGRQIVVVGDSKQMPPSDFFSRSYESDEDEEENITGDIESILGMFLSQGAREKMLKWHYRSKHDSLINVSNKEFYEGKLMVFPSSGTDSDATGLSFKHIPESVYERGMSRTNPVEARKVAEAVMLHAKNKKELTLGVVAFSTAQRDCIILELERLRRTDASAEKFFSKDSLETFFVKNLENVQGDERDVIYISIGYGRTAHGKIPTSFGPLNREGGERRLNVLISRARLAMQVFSNFTADELNTKSNSPFGVKALKSFLKYAETGKHIHVNETGKETDSPFEDQVIKAITELGYMVEPQVGSSGFFIDIAVIDPNKPGRYILAIECDGASYHSSASARDRDRLRQNVLEGLGWKFHRIWSTDWFRSPKNEISKIKEAIQNALSLEETNTLINKTIEPESKSKIIREVIEIEATVQEAYKIIEFIPGFNPEIFQITKSELALYMKEILVYEGVLHIKEVSRRLSTFSGFKKVGKNMLDHFTAVALLGDRKGIFHFDSEYLYLTKDKEVTLRNRSALDPKFKSIDFISDREIQLGILKVIEDAFSISEKEVISECLLLLGISRSTKKSSEKVLSNIEQLKLSKKIIFTNEKISLVVNL